ncbi:hypothetical protein DVQ18_11285 [Yersinia enterocolitica]|nr:hypothetical protein [Yersinia enterocolitica]EKN6025255.1 hypothetical protein [Yersinia enterocolitica]EKN6029573.1 hypothetical protein [Yersinia enterocolitica]EKN6104566.1 hypothetical protein [Yersinia enterocolitica]
MIRPVLFSSVVKGMYHFTGLVIEVFQFLLMVLDMKLQQSVVCTGMALDRGGLATYNRFTRAALYKTIVFIKLRRLCDVASKIECLLHSFDGYIAR